MADMKIFDERGNAGIAVYKARKIGESEWQLMYVWVDFNRSFYIDNKTGEYVYKGFYMYVYYGQYISSMISYNPDGLVGKVLIGIAERNTNRDYTRHASLVTYFGEEVLQEVLKEFEIDYVHSIHIELFNSYTGKVLPTKFIADNFPTYVFKPFWQPEKWDRLPEDCEYVKGAN